MSDPAKSNSELPPEQQAIRDKCFHSSGTFVEFPIEDVETSIPERFEKIVRLYPDRIAVKEQEKSVTYSTLNRAADRLASMLIDERDVDAEPVGLLFENGISLIAAILGVLKAGKFFVPLDPLFPNVRNAAVLNDSGAKLLIADNTNVRTAAKFAHKNIRLLEFESLDNEGPYETRRLPLLSRSLVYVAYTSGSTGEPKGVMNNHRNVLHDVMLRTNAYHISYLDKLSLIATANVHAVNNMFFALLNGAMLLPFGVQEKGVDGLIVWMARERISICRITVQLFREVCGVMTGNEDLGDLRLIQFAGDSRFNSDVDLWKKCFPSSCLLANGISSSETGYLTDYLMDHAIDLGSEVMPAGYPVENKEICLLGDNGEALSSNQIGELAVKSSFLSPGYWLKPELTREKFAADPGSDGKQTYLTGDLGLFLPDGCLVYKGRKDFRVKIRGHNVEPAEIETALRQHKNIKEACVAMWEGGRQGTYLVGYVVSEQATPTVDDLRSFLNQSLPEYMIPSTFVFMESLPSTNGKLDRKALPDPENQRPQLITEYIPPRNDIEERLVRIWQIALGIHLVGIHDNFFELGGHSLLAMRILSALNDGFAVEVSMRSLLDAPTVAGLAEQIELLRGMGDQTHPALTNRSRPLIAVGRRDRALPLSYAEEGLWLIEQIQPGISAWNMQSRLRLRGALDALVLRRSLNALVERHETLRTAYQWVASEPVRIIVPDLTVELPLIQLDPSLDADAEINRISIEDERQPFDLAEAPLFRPRLVAIDEQNHVLIITQHHIIADAWSSDVFTRELFTLYEAHLSGRPSPLPDLPVQYSDYALWIRQIEEEDLADQLSYWREKLDGCAVQEIPSDKDRPVERSYRGGQKSVQLSKESSRALGELCKKEQATLFMLLVAAFKILLSRYTGSRDIVVGSTLAGRSRPELENLIGMFINILPLRTDLSGQPTFREFLRRVRETCLEAYQNQDISFEKLVEELNPNRGLNRNPFFQVLFNVVNRAPRTHAVDGLTVEPIPRLDETARFDLTLYAPQTRDGFEIIAAYNRSLFLTKRIVEMLEQYKHLLEQVVDNPDQKIGLYSLVTPSAKCLLPDPTESLDDTWHGSVHELIARYAQRQPDKVAVEDPFGIWSYKELNDRSNQVANYLVAYGIKGEDIVAVYGQRSAALVCALLGVLKAGAAFCVIDPSHPAGRVKEYLTATDPKALIEISDAEKPNVEIEAALKSISLRCRIMLPGTASAEASQFLSQYPMENSEVAIGPDDLAYVIFTSGSTGKPKGVMGRHGPLTHFLPWLTETFGLSENDRFSFLSSISTNKLQREIFTALCVGGTLCIPRTDDIGSFGMLDEWLRMKEISVAHLTPAIAQLLDDTACKSIPSVRRVFFGGDLLQVSDVTRAQKLMPKAEIVNFYNSSETQRGGGYIVFSKQRTKNEKDIPLGQGVKDVQLLILNQTGKAAGIAELGEICIRSPHMARGYLGDEVLTKERFIINPFTGIEGDRIYRTGEFGRYLPDGNVEFIARAENQVSIRGFRVDLGEIESVLKFHPSVSNAVVSLHENSTGRLIAHLVANRGSILSIDEIRVFLRARLPSYMIPATFIVCDSLQLTPTGKVDRHALPEIDLDEIDLERIAVAPRTPVEERLARIWEDCLGVNRVGIHDDFFDLGGHSLLGAKLVSFIHKEFHYDLRVSEFFAAPTVAQLAQRIDEAAKEQLGPGKKTWTYLCELQRGKDCKPVFVFPGGGGGEPEFFVYGFLARHVGAEYPVYGLRARGADGTLKPHTSVEQMADAYVEEIRAIQPEGPYFLVGECAGGVTAYEAARQLQAQGQEVAKLVLMDVERPTAIKYLRFRLNRWLEPVGDISGRTVGKRSRENYFIARISYHLKQLGLLSISGYPSYFLARLSNCLKPASKNTRVADSRREEAAVVLSAVTAGEELQHIERVRKNYGRTVRRFYPKPYNGYIEIIVSEKLYRRDPTLGWKTLALKGLSIHPVPGDHWSYIRDHVAVAGLKLRECLERAEKTDDRAVPNGATPCQRQGARPQCRRE